MRALTLKRVWAGILGLLLVGGVATLVVGVVMLLRGPSEVEVSGAGFGGPLSDGAGPDDPDSATSYGRTSQSPSARFRLMIESVGVNSPIETFGLDEDGLPQVPASGHVIAWYDFSAWPGRGSNAVFAGHLNWDRSPAVFEDLKWVDVGDEIKLELRDVFLSYKVVRKTNVETDDPASLEIMKPTAADTITLITCGGTWVPDPDEAYGGRYTDRVIIQAELEGERSPGGLPGGFGF